MSAGETADLFLLLEIAVIALAKKSKAPRKSKQTIEERESTAEEIAREIADLPF